MACFLVPTAEAIVVTAAALCVRRNLKKNSHREKKGSSSPFTLDRKLMLLSYLLWGGAALLAFEHLWHGEIVPWFPFLTAAADPADASQMLHEMATIGVTMAVIVTAAWGALTAAASAILKRPAVSPQKAV